MINFTSCRKTRTRHVQKTAGFHENTTEQEAKDLLANTMIEAGMSLERVQIRCPAKLITQAFLQFTDSDETQIHQISESTMKRNKRTNKKWISPAMDAEERFQQKRLGYIKCNLSEKHDAPLAKITLNRATEHVSIRGEIVVRTCANVSLKVQEVSRHRARSIVNRQMMRQQGQSENKIMSSLECARVSIGEERKTTWKEKVEAGKDSGT